MPSFPAVAGNGALRDPAFGAFVDEDDREIRCVLAFDFRQRQDALVWQAHPLQIAGGGGQARGFDQRTDARQVAADLHEGDGVAALQLPR